MSCDIPRAWEISRATPPDEHDPACSAAQTNGAFCCDCNVLFLHLEVMDNEFTGSGGRVIRPAPGVLTGEDNQ